MPSASASDDKAPRKTEEFIGGYIEAVRFIEGWVRGARSLDAETLRNRLTLMRGFAKAGFPFNKGLKKT